MQRSFSGLPSRRDERITLHSDAILLETFLEAFKSCRASVERHPQGRPVALHLENIGGAHSLVERPVLQVTSYALPRSSFHFGESRSSSKPSRDSTNVMLRSLEDRLIVQLWNLS